MKLAELKDGFWFPIVTSDNNLMEPYDTEKGAIDCSLAAMSEHISQNYDREEGETIGEEVVNRFYKTPGNTEEFLKILAGRIDYVITQRVCRRMVKDWEKKTTAIRESTG